VVKEWFRVPARHALAGEWLAQGLNENAGNSVAKRNAMHGERNRSLSTLLVIMVVLAILGVAWWKLCHPARGPYGAIAMSDSSLSYGGAWGYADPNAAHKRSIAECNKVAGGNDCVVKVSLKDNCGVLAISVQKETSFFAQSSNQVSARSAVMARCRASGAADCAIHENICTSAS
jgi:hypothetical protein